MPRRASRSNRKHSHGTKSDGLWLYGFHAVRAALANKSRKVLRAVLTSHAAAEIGVGLLGRARHEIADGDAISRLLPPGSVHQGVALQCEPLPRLGLESALGLASKTRRIVLVLDQITDPQNVGAILRSAAAFNVTAVVMQDRHAPPESGALGKAASGALDTVPVVIVVNIARALEDMAEMGFWRVALAGDGEATLKEALHTGDIAFVLGSEGTGIRRLVRENCDQAAYIPITTESLNVSNAAAVALYELRR